MANGQDAETVELVESGVDTSHYRPCPHPLNQALRIGFSGRLADEKAPLAFIDLASRMADDARFHFIMTGAGPLESQVRRRAARSNGAVNFLGVVPDIHKHLASLDVLVVPSVLDGRPVVVLEALALGVPVIATAVGGLPALVHEGETGFLVEPGDLDAVLAHLLRLADDRAELEALRTTARAFAERNLDAKAMNRTYELALRSLLSEPGDAQGATVSADDQR